MHNIYLWLILTILLIVVFSNSECNRIENMANIVNISQENIDKAFGINYDDVQRIIDEIVNEIIISVNRNVINECENDSDNKFGCIKDNFKARSNNDDNQEYQVIKKIIPKISLINEVLVTNITTDYPEFILDANKHLIEKYKSNVLSTLNEPLNKSMINFEYKLRTNLKSMLTVELVTIFSNPSSISQKKINNNNKPEEDSKNNNDDTKDESIPSNNLSNDNRNMFKNVFGNSLDNIEIYVDDAINEISNLTIQIVITPCMSAPKLETYNKKIDCIRKYKKYSSDILNRPIRQLLLNIRQLGFDLFRNGSLERSYDEYKAKTITYLENVFIKGALNDTLIYNIEDFDNDKEKFIKDFKNRTGYFMMYGLKTVFEEPELLFRISSDGVPEIVGDKIVYTKTIGTGGKNVFTNLVILSMIFIFLIIVLVLMGIYIYYVNENDSYELITRY